jgi:putative Mg2+ transporter-C (MgtC) family protein
VNSIVDVQTSDLVRVLAALVIGALIGGEREYRSKAAGFRTMNVFCVGAAVFTILSLRLGAPNSPDRIASTIITGIGFLGAGVVFKEGISISGLTTATSIWATAALGMAAGAGEFRLAAIGLVLVLVVLIMFDTLQEMIDSFHQKRSYKFQFSTTRQSQAELERTLASFRVGFRLRRIMRDVETISCWYDVWGSQKVLEEFSAFFVKAENIVSLDYSS